MKEIGNQIGILKISKTPRHQFLLIKIYFYIVLVRAFTYPHWLYKVYSYTPELQWQLFPLKSPFPTLPVFSSHQGMDSIPHNATKQDLHHDNIFWEFIENISLNTLLSNLNTCILYS